MSKIELIGFKSNNFGLNDAKRIMNPHQHSTLELSYIVDGELIINYQPQNENSIKTVSLSPKQLLIIKPHCQHYTTIPNKLTSIGVELYVENLNIIDYLQNSNYINKFSLALEMLNDFDDIIILNDTQNVGFCLNNLKHYTNTNMNVIQEAEYELELKKLFLEILKCKTDENSKTLHNSYIRKAQAIIQSNYSSNISIESISKKLNISSIYLQKLFREHLNTTIYSEITRTKIEKAKTYILKTNFTLKEISHKVGFNSPQIFISNFKKYVGMTPNEFKKKDQHDNDLTIFIEKTNYYN